MKTFPFLVVVLLFLVSCAGIPYQVYKSEADCVLRNMEGRSDILIEEVRAECKRIVSEQKSTEKPFKVKIGGNYDDPEKNPYPEGTLDYQIWEDDHIR